MAPSPRRGDINWLMVILIASLVLAGIMLLFLGKQWTEGKGFLDGLFSLLGD